MIDKLKKFLKDRGQTLFALQINGELIQLDFPKRDREGNVLKEKKKSIVFVTYNSDVLKKTDRVVFGYYVSIAGRTKFIDEDSQVIEQFVLDNLKDPKVLGIDLGYSEDDIDVTFECNRNLRLINIKQNIFTSVSNDLYFNCLEPRALSTVIYKELMNRFDRFYLDNYILLLKQRVLPYLNLVRKSNLQLKKLELFPVFCYVLVSGECIYNPLLMKKDYRELLFKTSLMRVCSEYTFEVKELTIYAASMKKLSEALSFSEPIKLSPIFLINIIIGLLNSDFPNDSSYVYMHVSGSSSGLISENEFLQLAPMDRADYLKVSTLHVLCLNYAISLAQPNATALYNCVKSAAFKFD